MSFELAPGTGGHEAARLLWAGIFPHRAIAPGPGVRYCAHSMTRYAKILALAAALVLSLGARPGRAEPQNVVDSITVTDAVVSAVLPRGTGAEQLLIVADTAGDELLAVEVRTGELVGTSLTLSVGCDPQDLLAVSGTLYVACAGADLIEVVDLAAFVLPDPSLTSDGTVAVGEGPNRLLLIGNGVDDYLVVQNETEKTASVISLSSMSAPVAINADDSTETGSAPVNVRLCGSDADPANRATPVGMGAGFERIYVACSDGGVSWFDPFNNMDFSLSAETPDLGSGTLTAAFGRAGEHGLFLQEATGEFRVIDVSQAESGGSVEAQALFSETDGTPPDGPRYVATGPADPRGVYSFIDPETGSQWLALVAQATSAQVDLFDVGDLSALSYSPPLDRPADHQFVTGLASIGAGVVRPAFASGNLFIPTGGAVINVIAAGPIPTFTSSQAPLTISGQADPGLGLCESEFPGMNLEVPWSASKSVTSCIATLIDTSDAETSIGCSVVDMNGTAEISAANISGITGSEEVTVHLQLSDAFGAVAYGSDTVLIDSDRPDAPTNVTGNIVNGMLFLNWAAATDPGDILASGVRDYVVEILRDGAPLPPTTVVDGTSLNTTIEAIDSMQEPLTSDDVLSVSIATCDNAGNRSEMLSGAVTVVAVPLGATARLGETGGCTLSQTGDNALLPLALMIAAAAIFWNRRRITRR